MELLLNINFLKCSLNDVCIERIANRKQQNTGSKLTSLKEIHGDSLENTEAATPPAHKVVYGITSETDVQGAAAFQLHISVFLRLLKGYTETSSYFFNLEKKITSKSYEIKLSVCTFKAFIVYYYVNNPLHIL